MRSRLCPLFLSSHDPPPLLSGWVQSDLVVCRLLMTTLSLPHPYTTLSVIFLCSFDDDSDVDDFLLLNSLHKYLLQLLSSYLWLVVVLNVCFAAVED